MAKEVVEDCLSFLVSEVLARRSGRFSGTIVWSWFDGRECSIRYETDWDAETPRVTLSYHNGSGPGNAVRQVVNLGYSLTHRGGRRWWLTCPLLRGGDACGRRVGCLYLPRGQICFGCRACYDLTYRSCQETYRADRRSIGR
jgi:hypothetical protein